MVLMTLRNLMRRFGVDINPFWIEREGLDLCKTEPQIRDDSSDYSLTPIGLDRLYELFDHTGWNPQSIERYNDLDFIALGLFRNEDLAALTMVRFKQFELGSKQVHLKDDEAYLENMYTYEKYRGRKLAPYLRFKCYEYLAAEGIRNCFSVTECLNRASRRFKAKLNTQHAALYLSLGLFKKYKRTYLLKRYRA